MLFTVMRRKHYKSIMSDLIKRDPKPSIYTQSQYDARENRHRTSFQFTHQLTRHCRIYIVYEGTQSMFFFLFIFREMQINKKNSQVQIFHEN